MNSHAATAHAPSHLHSIQPENAGYPFVPRLRIYRETMARDRGDFLRSDLVDVTVPVISLVFDYGEGRCFRASNPFSLGDEDSGVFEFDSGPDPAALPGPSPEDDRDRRAEERAQALLEGLGAIEIARLDDLVPGLSSEADYVVHVDDNVHALCSFTAHAVPRLEASGFVVSIDTDYPYQVVTPSAPWYARMEDDGQDWFTLDLGIEVDGHTVNLLPTLVELIESVPDDSSLKSLRRVATKFRVVRVDENRYLPVPLEQLTAILQVLIDLYDGRPTSSQEPRFPRDRALCLAALDEVAPGGRPFRIRGNRAPLDRARAIFQTADPVEVESPALNASLRPYQRDGLAWLQHLRKNDAGGVLADDMGLGKTLQTIAHLALEKHSGRMDVPSLVVMPTSLVGNWERELAKFAPNLRVLSFHGPHRNRKPLRLDDVDVVLTTYPVLIRDVDRLRDQPFHFLVLDEAQAIKNPRSRAHEAVLELDARHRLCLSGTPVENNLDELWALFDVVAPGLLGSAEEFRFKFRHPIEKEGHEGQLALLRQRVSPFVLRRTKEQVAKDLPPKTELVRPVEIRGAERELYESIRVAAHSEIRGLIKKKGLASSTVAILDALMKLRQACCHPSLVDVRKARDVSEATKFGVLLEMLRQHRTEGRRVLVFSQFARMLAIISEELLRMGVRHTLLTGATRDRQAAIDAFQGGKVDVFLISLKAGGTGLNLTRADTVIHYEPWWNPAAQSQATDRAYRIGQTRPVFVHNLIVAGSVEERMLRLQDRKRHLADNVLNVGAPTMSFSEDDIDDLFAPLDDG